MTHVWFWRSRLPERKGQLCRVLARGKMNSILVEFEDGFKVITSRFAIRLIKEHSNEFKQLTLSGIKDVILNDSIQPDQIILFKE